MSTLSPILALAVKDLRLLARDRGHMFFTFAWPLLVALFFGLLFGGPPQGRGSISLAVVDEDASAASRALVDRLAGTEGVKLTPLTRDEAIAAVRRGAQTGAVLVPKGFGEASARMFYGEPPEITLALDPSRKAEAAMLEGLVTGAAMQGMQRLFTDADYSRSMVDRALSDLRQSPDPVEGRPQLERFLGELQAFVESPAARAQPPAAAEGERAWRPLVVKKTDVAVRRAGPENAFMITLPQGVLWGLIGCSVGFALSLVIERVRGTLTRLQMSPLSRAHVLAGKALACFLMILAVEVTLFGVARAFLGVVPGSWPLLVLAALCLAFAFVGLMMTVSVLGRTEQTVSGVAWAVMLPLSMLGGGMIPLFAMPPWMLTLSHASPVKWGVLALEGAMWRGFTPAEMLLPCGILVAVGVAGIALGTRLFPGD